MPARVEAIRPQAVRPEMGIKTIVKPTEGPRPIKIEGGGITRC